MINISDESKCTGCTACYNICPKEAIELVPDLEGFIYPHVRQNDCINCALCEKVCPILFPYNCNSGLPEVYAAWNLNEDIRINSTSGGVFSAIAEQFLNAGGFVSGAEYTEDLSIKHTVISDKEHLSALRQSKYAQSDLVDHFKQLQNLLDKGERVLFCGSPCQVAGLKSFLKKDYINLFTVDFICRGIISQTVYKEYLKSVEKHSGAKIQKVHFKNKDYGWNRFSTKLTLKNGKKYHKDRYHDEYMVGYLKYNLYLRPCCYDCRFKSLPRVSDITLGDFWGIGEQDPLLDTDKGTSVILVNSNKGRDILSETAALLNMEKSSLERVSKGNMCLLNNVSKGEYRDYFFDHFETKDFIDLIHKIEQKAVWDRTDLTFKDRVYLIKKRIIGK